MRGEVKSTIRCSSSTPNPFTQVIMERKTGTNTDRFSLGPTKSGPAYSPYCAGEISQERMMSSTGMEITTGNNQPGTRLCLIFAFSQDVRPNARVSLRRR